MVTELKEGDNWILKNDILLVNGREVGTALHYEKSTGTVTYKQYSFLKRLLRMFKVFQQKLYHPWYWCIIPHLEIYYRPKTGGEYKDLGFHIGFLCFTYHAEIGERRPWN